VLAEKTMNTPTIRDVSNAVIEIRSSKLPNPKEIGNAGSFFKNPVISKAQFDQLKITFPEMVGYPMDEQNVKVAAGWLIEKAGWKGYREQDFGVHEKQALVLVNYGNSKGTDIYQLAQKIIQDVASKFQINLQMEVNVF
jgi:UDP-N-acetylmuramate dehydrogenase